MRVCTLTHLLSVNLCGKACFYLVILHGQVDAVARFILNECFVEIFLTTTAFEDSIHQFKYLAVELGIQRVADCVLADRVWITGGTQSVVHSNHVDVIEEFGELVDWVLVNGLKTESVCMWVVFDFLGYPSYGLRLTAF